MAEKETIDNGSIDGVLEQLKQSYSADASDDTADIFEDTRESDDVSGDELQARLRSQFMSESTENARSEEDDYLIDEDFLKDAYVEDGDDVDGMDEFEEEDNESDKENEYDYYEEIIQEDKKDALEEALQEEAQADQEELLGQGYEKEEFEEEAQEDDQENEEILLDEGSSSLQEEEYNQASQEIYEEEKDQEIQEDDRENIPLTEDIDDSYFEVDDDDSLWKEDENYSTITLDDIDEDDEEDAFQMAVDTRTDAEISEDNYLGAFYRKNEYDPYENMSFKERISEKAPTVDSLEAELNGADEDDDVFFEALVENDGEVLISDDETSEPALDAVDEPEAEDEDAVNMENLDRSDLALLLEFGYADQVLKSVSSEKIEEFSDDELIEDIEQKDDAQGNADMDAEDAEQAEEIRVQRLKKKLCAQYEAYRKKRSGLLIKFVISALLTLVLMVYELIPIFNSNLGGVFNRDDYFFAYLLLGLQLLILVALPAIKTIYESLKRIVSFGVDTYFLAGASIAVTVLYDFIVVFERDEIPSTFHFCAALVIVLAELSELMKLTAEIRNYEYYFLEYLYDDDIEEVELYKYTLARSEGRGSVAEKMYLGGLDERTEVYYPQRVDSTGGFFEASRLDAKRSRMMFGWVIASTMMAFILTIVSGIIYEEIWVAASAFLITFNLTIPLISLIAEWLPFERLSAQNYAYGAAFASEGATESLRKCDMLVFNDLHIFEKCDAKSVNLAIYDSTSKATLLSCLNSVYSEIGGPLESAFADLKLQSLGKCKINRISKNGVEALVGSSYSVLVGNEQFMSRYGVFFPKAALCREEDKIFTLCVSINNRASARIAVKYKINETFYNILQKLLEDNIYCSVQTYDPMISAELVARVRPYRGAPVNIVHKNSADYALEKHNYKTGALYSVRGEELSVLARGSRLNLAVALSNAKKMSKLRLLLNICAGALMGVGALIALMLVISERLVRVDWTLVLIYWIASGAILAGLFAWKFPQRDRFIFNKK